MKRAQDADAPESETTARGVSGPESLHPGPWWARRPLGSARHHTRSAASRRRPKAKLDHPAIFVSHLDRSIAFWRRAFGFELVVRWTRGGRVAAGETSPMNLPAAHLVDRDGDRIECWQLCDMAGRQQTHNPIDHFGLEVDDVVAAYATALAAGAKPHLEPGAVTSGDLRVDTAFGRGPADERIAVLRFH